ncbi:MAG: IdeS/Mac family cysteine endopeptidase, partial [Akkermansia sp.]
MRSLFLCCLLVACPSWAAVSACSGTVYDVGKGAYSRDPTVENRDDSRLCWAAAAANLIQYWQDSYYTSHNAEGALPPDGKNGTSYQSPVGTQYLAVYDAFVANFQNQGSQCSAGIDWWMKGTAAIDPAYQATLKEGADAAGYYSVLFDGLPSSCIVSLENQADAEHLLTDTLGQVLSRAGGALELGVSTAAGSGHAISCWGYETNAAGELTALYVTDSDDQRYGAFKLDVSKGEDGSLWVSSHNVLTSYGKNREPVCIRVVQYINTPESIAREAAAPADTLTGTEVTQNTCLTGDYRLTNLSIKPEAMLLATAGSLVLQGDAELSAANGLTVEDGALLSLSGLSRMESSGFSGVGMALTGRAYFSGVEHFVCEENGGGGLTNAVYLELRQCDSLSVRENSSGSADAPTTMAAGICNRQSMSILSCDSVQIADNKTVGQNVWGGGLLSLAGDLSDNRELVVACNQALSETAGSALGGGAYLIYANDITGNTSVQLTDNTAQIAAQDAAGECLAAGGGLLQTVYGGMACTSHWLRNDELVIARNKVIATCSGDSAAGAAVAQGGGLCIATQRDTVGSAGATIGSNTIVRIEDNSAEATHAGGAASAQGGGVYIGANGTLNMQENGSVSVAGNRADQGGAVYNSGCWSLRSNGSVSVSGNVTADRALMNRLQQQR